MKTRKMLWVIAQGRGPKWARAAAIDPDGTIYVPSVIAGSEMEIFLCASYDGITAILDGKHAYYPSDWMKREFPKAKELVEKIESRLRAEH